MFSGPEREARWPQIYMYMQSTICSFARTFTIVIFTARNPKENWNREIQTSERKHTQTYKLYGTYSVVSRELAGINVVLLIFICYNELAIDSRFFGYFLQRKAAALAILLISMSSMFWRICRNNKQRLNIYCCDEYYILIYSRYLGSSHDVTS